MSTTPAFSPIPTIRWVRIASVIFSPNWRRWTLDDLYEQCSDHITEYMASSAAVGRRPRISRILSYSCARRPGAPQGRVRPGGRAACSRGSAVEGGAAGWVAAGWDGGGVMGS